MTSYAIIPRLIVLGIIALLWMLYWVSPLIISGLLTVLLTWMIVTPDEPDDYLDDEYADD